MRLGLLQQGDWFGIATMAIGLGSLQTVLEEGNKDDWFGSPFIVRMTVDRGRVAGAVRLDRAARSKKPAVNLRLLTRRNFGLGTLANMLVGFALYGSVYLLPQYLGQAQGYNAEQIGAVMAWTGLPQLLIIPFVPHADGAVRRAPDRHPGPERVRRQLPDEHPHVGRLSPATSSSSPTSFARRVRRWCWRR